MINNQLASFKRELRGEKGFAWEGFDQAATFCAQHKINLDEALLWTDTATSKIFGGSQSFQAWSTKAMVLDSLGRYTEAEAAMKNSIAVWHLKRALPICAHPDCCQKGEGSLGNFENELR